MQGTSCRLVVSGTRAPEQAGKLLLSSGVTADTALAPQNIIASVDLDQQVFIAAAELPPQEPSLTCFFFRPRFPYFPESPAP